MDYTTVIPMLLVRIRPPLSAASVTKAIQEMAETVKVSININSYLYNIVFTMP